jgi:hypothetical protein
MELTSTKLECETIRYSFALNDLLPLVKVRHLESLQIFIRGPVRVIMSNFDANEIGLNLNRISMVTKRNYDQHCRLDCSVQIKEMLK